MKTIGLVSVFGVVCVLAACSGSDPADGAPGAGETEADAGRPTTVTTDPNCPKRGEVDELDANGTDDNCDGIDGMLNDTVFVVGGASVEGKGTPEAPVGSIAKAAEIAKAAGKHHVYVCLGTFTERVEITAPADLHVHGGFACDRNWRRLDATSRTRWASSEAEALRVTGGSKISFDRFDISASPAVEAGESSVGVALNGVNDAVLTDVSVTAGNGAPGAAGAGGTQLAARGASANGNFADFPGYPAAAVEQDCTLPGGPSRRAGAGGAAAARVRQAGDSGGNSSEGTDGGDWRDVPRGDLFVLSWEYAEGTTGASGQAGAAGLVPAHLLGTLVEGRYVPSLGASGTAGTDGHSGGGGAPGVGVEVCWGYFKPPTQPGGFSSWTCHGASVIRGGGGGGAGGCYGAGGAAGGAGQSGGASIAILASGSTLQLKSATLRSANGGAGGAGGEGTPGQLGGAPGQGGAASRWEQASADVRGLDGTPLTAGPGFPGGKGGNGGAGGAGGAGAGGPSVGIYVLGAAPVVDASTVRYELGSGGSGGAGAPGGTAGPAGVAEQLVTQ